jgi:hypothetical protein
MVLALEIPGEIGVEPRIVKTRLTILVGFSMLFLGAFSCYAQNSPTHNKTLVISFCKSLEDDLNKDLNCKVVIDPSYSDAKLKGKVSDAPDILGPIIQNLVMTVNEDECPKARSVTLQLHQLSKNSCKVVIYFGGTSSTKDVTGCDLYGYLHNDETRQYILRLIEGK